MILSSNMQRATVNRAINDAYTKAARSFLLKIDNCRSDALQCQADQLSHHPSLCAVESTPFSDPDCLLLPSTMYSKLVPMYKTHWHKSAYFKSFINVKNEVYNNSYYYHQYYAEHMSTKRHLQVKTVLPHSTLWIQFITLTIPYELFCR